MTKTSDGNDRTDQTDTPPVLNSGAKTFAVASFDSIDTWLAESAANMHIVNDKKWVTTFRPLKCDISTADNASILVVQGGNSVKLTTELPEGSFNNLIPKYVAYAPRGRCNLLSIGELAKEGTLGKWNDIRMTFERKQDSQTEPVC